MSVTVRKALAFVFLGVFLVFTASGSVSADKSMVDTSRYEQEPPYVIGYDTYWLGNTWSVQFQEEFKRSVRLYDDFIQKVIYTSSGGSTSTQISNVEDLISKGVDVIIVTPNSPTGFKPVLEKAQEAGIPVIMNASIVEQGPFTSFVSVDDRAFGRIGAQWLVDELNGEGQIIAISGKAGISVAEKRWEGAKAVFDQHPGIEVLTREFATWSRPKAKQVVSRLLPAYPQIDGVWSGGGMMTAGAMEAFLQAGRPLVPMTGEDQNGFLKMWLRHQDDFNSIGLSKPTWLGAESLRVAIEVLQGIAVPREKIYRVPIITEDRLEKFVRPDLPNSYWTRTRLGDETLHRIFE